TLCRGYILDAFRKLGWRLRAGQCIQPEALMDRLGIDSKHRRITGRFIRFLEEDGVVTRSGSNWLVRRTCRSIDTDRLWQKVLHRLPSAYPALALLRKC